MRSPRVAGLVAVLTLGSPATAAVTLHLSSATVARPGDAGRLCVSLDTGGQEVAGTQNDLVWDGRCATLPSESACMVAGTHGKELNSRIQGTDDFRLRALILSLTDVDPIADGLLYCCDFTVDASLATCCSVAIDRPGAADSNGSAVASVSGDSAELCVAAVEDPSPTPPPTATPLPSTHDDAGCQIAPARVTAAAPWLTAVALLFLRRRR